MKHQFNISKQSTHQILLAGLGIFAGGALWLIGVEGYRPSIFRWAVSCYQYVGITIVVFIPLSIWALKQAVSNHDKGLLTLGYIGTTAQRLGLLGTVIGIVAAMLAIGAHMSQGADAAVVRALPAVGQALISTGVGFVIALLCDFFRYIYIRRNGLQN